MSANNDKFFNLLLVLIASIVDALWYLILVNIVTTNGVLELIKNKSYLFQKIVGFLFIVIAIFLLIDLFR